MAKAIALFQRIRSNYGKFNTDPRMLTEIARLSFNRELSDAQTVTAFRIGEIYHRYFKVNGVKVMPKSPAYEVGSLGSPDNPELTEEQQEAVDRIVAIGMQSINCAY
jgi:hypothetical protein